MKDYRDKGLLGVCIELKNNNYGSMLQSFATQEMLRGYGIPFELISYRKKYTPAFIVKSIPRLLNRVVWQDKMNENEKKHFVKSHPELKEDVRLRAQAFEGFRKQYFKAPVASYYGYEALQAGSHKYAAFLTGSDQLWSPSGLPTNLYNLIFTYDGAMRISYASSFGVKEIPWYQKRRTAHYLNRIPFVSCREESGADIVKGLTGREVPVVADPTMLFDAREWEEILPCTENRIGEKYIFSYMLGTSEEHRRQVRQLSKDTGLPIVSIHQFVEADYGFGDYIVRDAGPVEFVNLIRNAECICTDSFHGSVFSVLNHKKFVVFNRYSEGNKASKNTRIDNLCKRLAIEERRYSGNIVRDMEGKIAFEWVDEKMKAIRDESRRYLEDAFDAI